MITRELIAHDLGANAVVALRYDAAEVGAKTGSATEVSATARRW